jgi:hypothetical protein
MNQSKLRGSDVKDTKTILDLIKWCEENHPLLDLSDFEDLFRKMYQAGFDNGLWDGNRTDPSIDFQDVIDSFTCGEWS